MNRSKMPDIYVTFQGGGAYLAKMLPIAHALQNMHEKRLVNIRGVAGASAGSICAALLAGRCDFDALRAEMKVNLESDLRKLAKRFYDPLSWAGIIKTTQEVTFGKDLIDRAELRKFIEGMTSIAPTFPSNIDDFHKNPNLADLHVARAKLSPNFLDIESKGDLLDILVDSCSIPFALKNFKSANDHHYVDGGLCENLPIKCFSAENDVPIFAVSVSEEEEVNPGKLNLLTFLLKLFSTTIGYSVVRSTETLGENFCLVEKADFKFHEVKKAVEWYLDDAKYKDVKDRYEARLRGFSEYYRVSAAGSVFLSGESTLTKRNTDLKSLFAGFYKADDWEVITSTMLLTAHSATRESDPSANRTDIVQNIGRLKANKDGVKMYKSHILLAKNRLHPTTWSVYNVTKKRSVEFRAMHYQDPNDGGADVDPCFLVFDNPMADISKNDIIEVQAILPTLPGANMQGLLTDGDFIIMHNRHQNSAHLSVILRYPVALGTMRATSRNGNTVDFDVVTDEESIEFINRHDVEFKAIEVRSKEEVRTGECVAVDFAVCP